MDRCRLQVLAAKWRLGAITPHELRSVAGALLEEGEESPALIELFSLTPETAPLDGQPLFARTLEELGAPRLDEDTAAAVIASWLSESVLDGSMTPRQASAEGASFYVLSDYASEPLSAYYALDDEYDSIVHDGFSYMGRRDETLDDEVRQLAQRVVSPK